jgi:hypothetical protein
MEGGTGSKCTEDRSGKAKRDGVGRGKKGGEIGPMGLSFHTRYVGTLMLMAGAVLEVIAYMSGWPATRTRRK